MDTSPLSTNIPPATPPTAIASVKKYATWIVIFVLVSGGSLYKFGKDAWTEFTHYRELAPYAATISGCVQQKEAAANGQKIIGLDYSCAIETAATFYESDPEKAILLCKKYNPFFKPSGNTDDVFEKSQEQIARAACRSSIERVLQEKR